MRSQDWPILSFIAQEELCLAFRVFIKGSRWLGPILASYLETMTLDCKLCAVLHPKMFNMQVDMPERCFAVSWRLQHSAGAWAQPTACPTSLLALLLQSLLQPCLSALEDRHLQPALW